MRVTLAMLITFIGCSLPCIAADADKQSAELPVVKLKPAVRTVDRDWRFFQSVPCENLSRFAYHSEAEKKLLARRKAQCVERYKAFIPAR